MIQYYANWVRYFIKVKEWELSVRPVARASRTEDSTTRPPLPLQPASGFHVSALYGYFLEVRNNLFPKIRSHHSTTRWNLNTKIKHAFSYFIFKLLMFLSCKNLCSQNCYQHYDSGNTCKQFLSSFEHTIIQEYIL